MATAQAFRVPHDQSPVLFPWEACRQAGRGGWGGRKRYRRRARGQQRLRHFFVRRHRRWCRCGWTCFPGWSRGATFDHLTPRQTKGVVRVVMDMFPSVAAATPVAATAFLSAILGLARFAFRTQVRLFVNRRCHFTETTDLSFACKKSFYANASDKRQYHMCHIRWTAVFLSAILGLARSHPPKYIFLYTNASYY